MKVAGVTMVFNEKAKFPLWKKYYGEQLTPANCYVIDHGSDDGSTDDIAGFNIIRLPRSPQNNEKRTLFVSQVVNALLQYYDYVFYTDCDEILLPDPRKFSGIIDYCEKVRPDYITSIGVDLLHKYPEEAPLDPTKSILQQRSYGHYSSAMNKPNLTSKEVVWWAGFHSRELPAKFGDVFLFHLRYVDMSQAVERLAITRNMPWARPDAGAHQKVSDTDMVNMVGRWTKFPVLEGDPWSAESGRFSEYLKEFKASEVLRENNATYWVDTVRFGTELIKLPTAFTSAF